MVLPITSAVSAWIDLLPTRAPRITKQSWLVLAAFLFPSNKRLLLPVVRSFARDLSVLVSVLIQFIFIASFATGLNSPAPRINFTSSDMFSSMTLCGSVAASEYLCRWRVPPVKKSLPAPLFSSLFRLSNSWLHNRADV